MKHSKDVFRFKQFEVRQGQCAMKVGTDGVLLGALADVSCAKRVLDVGTGTGLIALMIAQRSRKAIQIDAIDIDSDACLQASENFSISPWSERLSVWRGSFPEDVPEDKTYDLVMSNPPFFSGTYRSKTPQREAARNRDFLPLSALFEGGTRVLNPDGKISLILPFAAHDELLESAAGHGMSACRIVRVIPKPGNEPKRIMVEFSFAQSGKLIENELIVEAHGRHQYSEEYIRLTRDFYLAH